MGEQKKNIQQQIQDLIDKGVYVSNSAEAEQYLRSHVNYYRLSSYLCFFDTQRLGTNAGKYVNVSFEQLNELSRIDLYIRRILLSMCIDIEFAQKLELNNDCSDNNSDDGVSVVQAFLKSNQKIQSRLNLNLNTSPSGYGQGIIKKHINDMHVWHLLEVLPFGEFIQFWDYYYAMYPSSRFSMKWRKACLWSVRKIRNSCAHNNFLIPNMYDKQKNVSNQMGTFFMKFMRQNGILSPSDLKLVQNSYLISDVLYVLFSYKEMVLKTEKSSKAIKELHELLDVLIPTTTHLKGNYLLTKPYNLIKTTVDTIFK